jgi:FkbM family methyltransferase
VPELAAGLGVVTIVDVGAQALPDQDDVYRPLVRSGRARVVGFEPLAEARAARQRQDPGFVVHPHALGDGAPRTLHRTATSATSSLYRPDLMRMADFAGLAATCRVVGETPVSTVRLDDVADCRGAAFCKLDVQGAELDVLRGAPRLLTELLVLHTETEFVPLYQGQPLFADLDAHLRGAGFELYAFPHLEHYRYETRGAPPDGSPSRLLWGDAVYVPTRERILALAPGRALALAWIMHELYRAHDFCRWVLTHLDARDGGARVAAYDRALAPDPVRLAR